MEKVKLTDSALAMYRHRTHHYRQTLKLPGGKIWFAWQVPIAYQETGARPVLSQNIWGLSSRIDTYLNQIAKRGLRHPRPIFMQAMEEAWPRLVGLKPINRRKRDGK